MWDTLEKILTVIGVAGAVYSAWSWYSFRRREKVLSQPVRIRLVQAVTGSPILELPYQPPRRQIIRAEVLGFLGMVSGQPRFTIAFLNSPDFFNRLADIADGSASVLEIRVTPEEQAVFTPASEDVRRS